jgi:hypothetical protein
VDWRAVGRFFFHIALCRIERKSGCECTWLQTVFSLPFSGKLSDLSITPVVIELSLGFQMLLRIALCRIEHKSGCECTWLQTVFSPLFSGKLSDYLYPRQLLSHP